MKFVLYTNSVSPHQLPLAKELVELLGADNYRYVYTTKRTDERRCLGWADETEHWIIFEHDHRGEVHQMLETADVVMSTVRNLELFEHRIKNGLLTIYTSERWFKPRIGFLRMLNPAFFAMAWRMASLLKTSKYFYYYPMGVHAASDMARVSGLFSWDARCLFRAPALVCVRQPCAKIMLDAIGGSKADNGRHGVSNMRLWGYFVKPSEKSESIAGNNDSNFGSTLRVLWVGRLLSWKRVDTIIKAMIVYEKKLRKDSSLKKVVVDIYGVGPEEPRILRLAAGVTKVVRFHPPVEIAKVRELMRAHDIYILSSDGCEGWGAVVNEALEEGMRVVGTFEAGSSATILPSSNLFKAGDWKQVVRYLHDAPPHVEIGSWAVKQAAKALVNELGFGD